VDDAPAKLGAGKSSYEKLLSEFSGGVGLSGRRGYENAG
jgi:hypothetical protein